MRKLQFIFPRPEQSEHNNLLKRSQLLALLHNKSPCPRHLHTIHIQDIVHPIDAALFKVIALTEVGQDVRELEAVRLGAVVAVDDVTALTGLVHLGLDFGQRRSVAQTEWATEFPVV